MKRHVIHSGSCSCTSCVYKSQSKRPSIQHLIQEGSRIDRLYFGKYLPLRERKLLEKLIRTRGVYDDVRNQLLSTSGSSDETRSDHKMKRRDDDSTEKSSAVLKIVDLVDRGQIGSTNTSKLSSCCSCCSCSSLRKIKKHMEKHPRVHRHHVPYEEIAKYTAEAERRGRRRRKRLSTKISSKIRSVRFKVKQVQSEPCTCTLSLSSIVKRPSKEFLKKVRSKEKVTANAQAQKVVTIERKALKNKIHSCSIKKIKNIRKSTTRSSGTQMGNKKAFRIKKDSLTLFREKLQKKRALKDWECEPGFCVVDECIPEQCLIEIKARGVGETRRRKYHNRISGTSSERSRISMSTRPKKIKRTDSRVQASPKSDLGPVVCECKPISKSASSMTTFTKSIDSRPLGRIKSTVTEIKVKRRKSAKQKPQVMLRDTEYYKFHDKSNLGSVICECKPTTKSEYSMTDILKAQALQSVSRTVLKRPMAPKPKQQKETVIQEKNYKTDRHKAHEMEPVQAPPKSKLGHVICECKPSTRSTSSMSLTQKQSKQAKAYKTKRYTPRKERYDYYETESRGDTKESGKQAVKISSSFKFEIEFSKKRHPALTDKELFEHVKVIRAKRNNQKHGKNKQKIKYQHSTIHGSGILSKSNRGTISSQHSQTSYLRDSTSQTTKPTSEIHQFPRDCDPLMCIPDECDPEHCDPILLSRSKSQGRSFRSSTDRTRHKSAGSTTSSLKTSSKSKYIHSKSMDTFLSKTRELPHQMVETDVRAENSYPQKQAVRIGSSFSFNIEFYKQNPPDLKTNDMQDISYVPQKEIKPKVHKKKIKERGHGSKNENFRQISSQSRSSQSIKNIQVGHGLKRCICTLKLLQKQKPKVIHAASKKTMVSCDCFHDKDLEKRARIRQTQTKSSGIAYVIPPVTSSPPGLLPYECEPLFCTPGECDPYECAERIKVRNLNNTERMKVRNYKKNNRYTSKETNTFSTPRKSALTFTSQTSSKSLSKKNQSSSYEYRKQKKKISHSSKTDNEVSSEKTGKQAVRIGSSFSFNVEFSKENINRQGRIETTKAFMSDKPIRKERKRIQQKGIKVHKPRVRHENLETTKKGKVKQTYTSPFLQRCFCTLKLFNQNKKKIGTITPLQNKKDFITNCMCVNKSITTNRANVSYQHEQTKRSPYTCDPYECEKRNMKLQNKYSNIDDLTARSSYSETSRTITSKSRNTKSDIRWSKENIKKRKGAYRERKGATNYSNGRPIPSDKQAVRIGSNFSFNVEFYKTKPSTNDTRGYVIRKPSRDKSIKKNEHKKVKQNEIGSQQLKPHQRAIHAETKNRAKGIYVGSAIKRCFCTLKFHKKGKNERLQVNNVPNPQICECKSKTTSYLPPTLQPCDCNRTKTKRNKPTYDLKKYECAPDFCVPGMCNPYECYEEIKRRDMKPQNCDCKLSKTSYRLPNSQKCECKSKSTSYQPSVPQPCECKSTIKKKGKPIKDLKNYECAPDFCVPGMCNPYECYEEIKRRDIISQPFDYKKSRTSYQPPNPQICECKSIKTSYEPPTPNPCECKSTSTKRSKPTYNLKNYECAPDFCVPGMCNPYECYEEIKRRDIISQPFDYKKSRTSYQPPNSQICECKSIKTSYEPPTPHPCECKSTSTKKSKPTYDLKNYECEPDFCVPGMCYPYECYKKIKRREMKRLHDRSICTERCKRKSNVSLTETDFIDSGKSKSTQSRIVKRTPKHIHKAKVVREDQRPTSSFSPSRQAVRIGSNFSFNLEFFKDRSAPTFPDTAYKSRTPKYSTVSDTTTVNKRKHRGTKEKRDTSQYQLSQTSNIIRKEHKASNVGFILKRCFCTLGLHKKNIVSKNCYCTKQTREYNGNPPVAARFVQVRVDQNKNKTYNFEDSNVIKSQEQDILKDHAIIKSKSHVPYRTLFAEECLQLNLRGGRLYDGNISGQHCTDSSTLTKSTHLRSRIHFNTGILKNKSQSTTPNFNEFDRYKLRNLLNDDKQKMNSFYQSFYALNLQVSNMKNMPPNTYALEDNECEPGSCIPYECDPVECFKRIDSRLKHSKSTGTARPKTKSVPSFTRSQLESKNRRAEGSLNKYRETSSQPKYSSNRKSQRETSSHPSRQELHVGSNFSFAMEFYKDTNTRIDDDMNIPTKKPKQAEDHLRNTDTQINVERQNKKAGLSPILKRCFCTLKLKNNSVNRSINKQKPESKQATTAGNIKKSKTANKVEKNKTYKKKPKQEKDESIMVNKPYSNVIVTENRKIMTDKLDPYECAPNVCVPGECDPRKCYKLIQQRLKKLRENGVGTDKPKYKSTSSLAKKQKQITTKTFQSKQKIQHENGILRPSNKQAVSFGSNISFNMEFYKDRNGSLSSNFSPVSERTGAQTPVSPVYYTNVKGAGDNRKKAKDNRQTDIHQPKTEEAGTNVANMLNRCFCTLKLSKRGSKGVSKSNKIKKEPVATSNIKSILKPYECEPQTCVIDKCSPIECDKRIQKRRLRSKSTKVNGKREAKSVKSAVIDKSTATKGKRLSKSFGCEPYVCIPDKCNPYDCMEKLKARGIIFPDVRERATKKVKHSSLSTQRIETKSINKESILKRCVCVLKFKKSKPSNTSHGMRCDVCEPKIDTKIKTQADLNKLVKKCLCTLKLVKGGKELVPKKSKEHILHVKNRDKLKKTPHKHELKLEKKVVDKHAEKEMETLMPYSKKKFKNLESKTIISQAKTNTEGIYPCTCSKDTFKQQKQNANKKNKKPVAQTVDQLVICPVCKDSYNANLIKSSKNKTQDTKNSLDSNSPNKKMEHQLGLCPTCKVHVSKTPNKKQNINDQLNLCPVCKNPVRANLKEKQDGKMSISFCLAPKKKIGDQSDPCPACKTRAIFVKCNKKKDGKKSIPFCLCANEQIRDQSDFCPLCKTHAAVKNNKKIDGKKTIPSCLCPHEQMGNQSDLLCPVCKAQISAKYNKKKDGRKPIPSCLCPNEQVRDQSVICPVCEAQTSTKAHINVKKMKSEYKKNKKPDKKEISLSCPCCNNQCARQNTDIKDVKTSKKSKRQVLKNDNQSDLCSNYKFCENATLNSDKAKQKKQEDKNTRADNNKKMGLQNGSLDVCSCCNSMICRPPIPSPPLHLSPFGTVMNILKCKYSGFFIGRKEKKEVEKEEAPFFEMFVNKSTMNIINRDEVLANLGARGKESEVMKKARIAGEQGKLYPPVMELLINKDSATIINSEEIFKTMLPFEERKSGKVRYGKKGGLKICTAKCQSLKAAEIHKKSAVNTTKSERTASSRRHGSNCRCCECLRKLKRVKYASFPVQKSGAGDGKPAGRKGSTPVGKDGKPVGKDGKLAGKDGKPVGKDGKPVGKDGKLRGAKVPAKPRKLKPCICGSVVCKRNWNKLKREARSIKSMKIKQCVCGSDICTVESKKMPSVLLKAARKSQRDKEKALQRILDEQMYQQERLRRKALYAKQDTELWQKRKKRDKHDMKLVKKYEEKTADCLKAAESAVDIGKFGVKALHDVMRYTFRYVKHPRDGVYILKDAKKHPGRITKNIEKSWEGMGFVQTAARVRRRIFSMQFIKAVIAKLESYPITNFILHLADKDPKHRMKKFKKKRLREPVDFECSLFMGSLRKRPCLSVYYMCPWFYPHCISLLGALKQCTDIFLFILAVGVWSPCILCMELCRAMVCCCLCTA